MESETEKSIQWNTWQQKLSMKIYFFPQTLEYLNDRIQTDYEEKKKDWKALSPLLFNNRFIKFSVTCIKIYIVQSFGRIKGNCHVP